MDHYAGIDVSLDQSSVCVVDATGKIVQEAKVASEPDALVRFFADLGFPVVRIGLEAGPLSQWLHAGLSEAGLATVLLETRHVKARSTDTHYVDAKHIDDRHATWDASCRRCKSVRCSPSWAPAYGKPWSPKEAIETVLAGHDLQFANGWKPVRAKVYGDARIEPKGPFLGDYYQDLKKVGVVQEMISGATRFFVPLGRSGVMAKVIQYRPVVDGGLQPR